MVGLPRQGNTGPMFLGKSIEKWGGGLMAVSLESALYGGCRGNMLEVLAEAVEVLPAVPREFMVCRAPIR